MTNSQSPQPAQGTEDDVRKAFESEMRFKDVWGHKNLRRDKHGDYLNSWTGAMWLVWKACAANYAEQVARAERNRDMWREQCRGQAAQLEAMRAIPAPEGGDLLRAAALRAIAALERVSHTTDQERIAAACDLRVALAAPAPQDSLDSAQPSNQVAMQAAPVALTDEQIDKLPWGPHEGNPVTFAEGLRDFANVVTAEFCRINGIPAPQTKEPTNDR